MQELFRTLKNDGTCLIQTPFKEGTIYENESIDTPEGRKEHFGQEDHLRIYSAEGLKSRLESVGFNVSTLSFSETLDNYHGFAKKEIILICKKDKE